MYKDLLKDYLRDAQHTPQDLKQALSWHIRLQETGSMHPDHADTKQPTSKDTEKAAKKMDETAAPKK
jgi:hypothetical protein